MKPMVFLCLLLVLSLLCPIQAFPPTISRTANAVYAYHFELSVLASSLAAGGVALHTLDLKDFFIPDLTYNVARTDLPPVLAYDEAFHPPMILESNTTLTEVDPCEGNLCALVPIEIAIEPVCVYDNTTSESLNSTADSNSTSTALVVIAVQQSSPNWLDTTTGLPKNLTCPRVSFSCVCFIVFSLVILGNILLLFSLFGNSEPSVAPLLETPNTVPADVSPVETMTMVSVTLALHDSATSPKHVAKRSRPDLPTMKPVIEKMVLLSSIVARPDIATSSKPASKKSLPEPPSVKKPETDINIETASTGKTEAAEVQLEVESTLSAGLQFSPASSLLMAAMTAIGESPLVRGYLARKDYDQKLQAIIMVQSLARMNQAKQLRESMEQTTENQTTTVKVVQATTEDVIDEATTEDVVDEATTGVVEQAATYVVEEPVVEEPVQVVKELINVEVLANVVEESDQVVQETSNEIVEVARADAERAEALRSPTPAQIAEEVEEEVKPQANWLTTSVFMRPPEMNLNLEKSLDSSPVIPAVVSSNWITNTQASAKVDLLSRINRAVKEATEKVPVVQTKQDDGIDNNKELDKIVDEFENLPSVADQEEKEVSSLIDEFVLVNNKEFEQKPFFSSSSSSSSSSSPSSEWTTAEFVSIALEFEWLHNEEPSKITNKPYSDKLASISSSSSKQQPTSPSISTTGEQSSMLLSSSLSPTSCRTNTRKELGNIMVPKWARVGVKAKRTPHPSVLPSVYKSSVHSILVVDPIIISSTSRGSVSRVWTETKRPTIGNTPAPLLFLSPRVKNAVGAFQA